MNPNVCGPEIPFAFKLFLTGLLFMFGGFIVAAFSGFEARGEAWGKLVAILGAALVFVGTIIGVWG